MVEDVEDGGYTPEDTDMVLDTPSPRGMYVCYTPEDTDMVLDTPSPRGLNLEG